MKKLLPAVTAVAVAVLMASAAQACDWHKNVTASADTGGQSVTVGTHDQITPIPAAPGTK